MKSCPHRLLVLVVLCVCLLPAWGDLVGAQQDLPAASSSTAVEPDEEALRRTLDYLTEIATRTRLNADDTPGMITVLYGRDLENQGFRTVAEAVSLVPGMRLTLTGENVWRMVIRGVPRAFASGQVKILLDGTPLTTAFGVDPVPNMPIEQVDRIEIVRGPVSVIHGEFADAGVMNIITRRKGLRVYGGVGQHDVYTAGGVAGAEDETGDVRVSLNLAGQQAEGATMYVNPGLVAGGMDGAADDGTAVDAGLFAEPEADFRDGDKIYYSGIAALQAGSLDLQAHGFVNRQTDFYNARLEGIRARYRLDPFDGVRVNWGLGWQTNRLRFDSDLYAVSDPVAPPEECLYGYDYDERQFQGQASVTADVTKSQTFLLQGDFSHTDLDDVTRGGEVDGLRYDGGRRRLTSLTLQDEIRLLEAFTLTAGLRYDHYDDIGDYTTPRLAAVWRLDPDGVPGAHHVIKAQIARAYRPPNYLDMTIAGGDGVSWDRDRTGQADTLELGYIYRSVKYTGRLSLFHSRIEPGQGVDAPHDDGGDIRSVGGEAELAFPLIPEKLTLDGNVSLVTLENDGDRVNDWMANLILTARPFRALTLSLLYRFEGPYRPLKSADAAEDVSVDGIHRLDLTVTLTPAWPRDVTFRLGVKNLTGADIRYPLFYNPGCSAPGAGGASEEQRLDRWWWTSVSVEF